MSNTYRVSHGYTDLGWHPQAILAQVRNTPVQTGWQVITGKKRSYTRQIFQGWKFRDITGVFIFVAILTIPVMFCETLLNVDLLKGSTGIRANFWANLPSLAIGSFLGVFAATVLIFLMYTVGVDVLSRSPLIVILPNGCMEYDQLEKIHAGIAFTDLASMQIHQFSDSKNTMPSADLTFKDGAIATWTPITPSATTVLAAFHEWRRLNSN